MPTINLSNMNRALLSLYNYGVLFLKLFKLDLQSFWSKLDHLCHISFLLHWLQRPSSGPLLKYDDLSPTRELAGAGLSRAKKSVGDIMSGGDLIRRPGTGDLLRSRELLAVEDFLSISVPGVARSSLMTLPRGIRDPPSPVREVREAIDILRETDVMSRENMNDFETYRTFSGSQRLTQHLISGRNSILWNEMILPSCRVNYSDMK